jgi:hypothetical protein
MDRIRKTPDTASRTPERADRPGYNVDLPEREVACKKPES